MHINRLIVIVSIVILICANAAAAQFGGPPVVTSKAFLSQDRLRPGDEFGLAVRAAVRSGFHIGAHAKDALYPPSLRLEAPKWITFDQPVYPKGERKALGFAPGQKIPVYEGTFVVTVRGRVAPSARPGTLTITAKLDTQACKGDQCYPPRVGVSKIVVEIAKRGSKVRSINSQLFPRSNAYAGAEAQGEAGRMLAMLERAPLPVRLGLLYLFGLLLAFTPCVYPMVPVTVGYFGTQAGARHHHKRVILLAAVYVLGISLAYSVLGAVAATTGGMIGAAMQQPAVIIGIAAVLVALALSMFGLYELKAPGFVQSRAVGRNGVMGALAMGLVFGIVAAPCVGPVVLGLLLYVAQLGSIVNGFLLFFVLSLGLGTPLFFLAAFSAKMPVPGMWMVTVKKLAGFLLLGVAAYFLQPVVPGSIGRYLVPAVLVAGGIYLGFFERSIRSGRVSSSLGMAGGAVALVFAIAMVIPHAPKQTLAWEPYSPSRIAQAARESRPAVIDFTAEWCGVCGELERGPFSDPKVIKAAERFRRLRVDGTVRSEPTMLAAVKKYAVKGFPTVIVLDSSGDEVASARIVGFVSSEEMVRRLDSVK